MNRRIKNSEDLLNDLRRTSNFLSGIAVGINYAIEVSLPDCIHSEPKKNTPNTYRSSRHATQRPILDVMRALKEPVTVSELIRILRANGHDPLRRTVTRAMQRLLDRGLIVRVGHRYQLTRGQEGLELVAGELDASLGQSSMPDKTLRGKRKYRHTLS